MKNKNILVFTFLLLNIYSGSAQKANYVIFVNGYRGYGLNHYTSDLAIIDPENKRTVPSDSSFKSDAWIIGYWRNESFNLDDSILKHYEKPKPLYVDGHHPLETSSHYNKFRLVSSWIKSRLFFFSRTQKHILNIKNNSPGFYLRFENGKKVGKKLIQFLDLKNDSLKISIVCHSMGFAVALGIINELKGKVGLQDFLILAPEQANLARCDWSIFRYVWHYSPSWNKGKYRMIVNQDGIAPQCFVYGLPNTKFTGLVDIPKKSTHYKLGFNRSHHLSYYNWFLNYNKGERGFYGDY